MGNENRKFWRRSCIKQPKSLQKRIVVVNRIRIRTRNSQLGRESVLTGSETITIIIGERHNKHSNIIITWSTTRGDNHLNQCYQRFIPLAWQKLKEEEEEEEGSFPIPPRFPWAWAWAWPPT